MADFCHSEASGAPPVSQNNRGKRESPSPLPQKPSPSFELQRPHGELPLAIDFHFVLRMSPSLVLGVFGGAGGPYAFRSCAFRWKCKMRDTSPWVLSMYIKFGTKISKECVSLMTTILNTSVQNQVNENRALGVSVELV